MCTANNTFTVEALVAKYRNYVEEHASYEIVGADNEWGFPGSVEYGTDGWADHQLLIKLYIDVAGDEADQSILDKLSKYGELFWNNVLTVEEYSFLRNNFKDTVAHIFSEGIQYGSDATTNSFHLRKVDQAFVSIARRFINAESESSLFIEDDILGDFALFFPQCKIICKGNDEESALRKIRLYAAGIQYKCIETIGDESINTIISNAGWFPGRFEETGKSLYAALSPNGTMIYHAHPQYMASPYEEAVSFRRLLISTKSLKSIIRYLDNSGILRYSLVIEKKTHPDILIQDAIFQKSKNVAYEKINDKIFFPGYYLTDKSQSSQPLSDLLDYYDYTDSDIPSTTLDQPLVFPNDLGNSFKDVEVSRRFFKKGKDYEDSSFNPISESYNVNFPSILLYGGMGNVYAGITKACEVPYAVLEPIACFTAKKGVDLRYVASILFDPIVSNQITALYLDFIQGGIREFMPIFLQSIMVPYHDQTERDKYLIGAYYDALCITQAEQKRENEIYRHSVRMRKHALTQSLSSIEAMFYALNEYRIRQKGELSDSGIISRVKGTTVKDAFEFLSERIKMMMPVLEHIADVEYSFGKSEWINPESFVENYIVTNEKGWLNFKPFVTWESGNNLAMRNFYNDEEGLIAIAKGEPLNKFLFPKNALTKVFDNIVSNARAWGFDDDNRKDYQLRFSWHITDASLIVEIANNGTPIPADRDVTSLLEYGVSTSLHSDGHNGIGCNEIDDIMHRYDGKVEIVSTPEDEFTVKYILTFNNVSTFRPNKAK